MNKRDRHIQDPFEQSDRPDPIERPVEELNYEEIEWTLQDDVGTAPTVAGTPANAFELSEFTIVAPDATRLDKSSTKFEEIKVTATAEEPVAGLDKSSTKAIGDEAPAAAIGNFEIQDASVVPDQPDASTFLHEVEIHVVDDDSTAGPLALEQPEGDDYLTITMENLSDG